MLGQCHRQWTNIEPPSGERVVFDGYADCLSGADLKTSVSIDHIMFFVDATSVSSLSEVVLLTTFI